MDWMENASISVWSHENGLQGMAPSINQESIRRRRTCDCFRRRKVFSVKATSAAAAQHTVTNISTANLLKKTEIYASYYHNHYGF